MPRKNVPVSSEFPYSINARCINKEWFQIPLEDVWDIMEDYLYFLHIGFGFKIKSFVLMSNHFHLIAQAPLNNLSEGMRYFMRETSRQIGKKANRINQVYGSRFYRSLITKNHHYLHAYKYVYRNPIEAGLSNCVTSYPYSTLNRLVGKGPLNIPIEYDHILFDSFDSTIAWLNQSPSLENHEAVRKAMRKTEFSFATDSKTKKVHILEQIMF
jgi:putative transposase